jgi:glycosyltransferase involved in cell wall biosynthesis
MQAIAMKSIGISGVFRRDQLAGGFYSFFENLSNGLAALNQRPALDDRFSLTVFHGSAGVIRRPPGVEMRRVPDRLGRFAANAWVGAVASRDFDAVLFPNYFTPPVVLARRTVSVIHDLQFRHMPQFFSGIKRQWLNACHHLTLRRCDAVVAISEVVRQDILNEYGATWENRVWTIHNPVSLDRFDGAAEQQFTGGRPYIMCVAMDRPQKNLHTLIQAFRQIKDRFPDHLLVMAGQLRRLRPDRHEKSLTIATEMPPTEDLVRDLRLQDRVMVTGFVSDAELGALYRGASAFVLPSLFEGFGMPAVEALALGTPALVSDLPVLREVTLGGALYVSDPRSVRDLAGNIADVLDNVDGARPSPELMKNLRSHYAPQAIARQYYELLAG